MQRIVRNLLISAIVGLSIALIYYGFESFFTAAIEWLWLDTLHTNTSRLLVVPVTVVMGLLYFTVLRSLDPKPDPKAERLLALPTNPSLKKIVIILVIGFFSMLAGASLGPEAILFPACLVAGLLLSQHAHKNDRKLMAYTAFTALMAAFFSSLLVGALSIILLVKNFKKRLPELVVYNIVACAVTVFILKVIFGKGAYVSLPAPYHFGVAEIIGVIALFFFGMTATYILQGAFVVSRYVHAGYKEISWYWVALVSSLILGIIYCIGGNLIRFTGNHSIEPMFEQASSLGVLGLVGIVIMKNVAIAWSRTAGYRGGMIFPTILVGATVAAIGNQLGLQVNTTLGTIAALIGIFFAGRGTKIFE